MINVRILNKEKYQEKSKEDNNKIRNKAVSSSLRNNQKAGFRVAVILVRGLAKTEQAIQDTLILLKLKRKNQCVVLEDNSSTRGMLIKVKDYITFGALDENTFEQLVEKRGEEYKGRLEDAKKKYQYHVLEYKGKKYKPYFYLSPPHKGFGRKGIKIAFAVGGALGERREKINDLIMRML